MVSVCWPTSDIFGDLIKCVASWLVKQCRPYLVHIYFSYLGLHCKHISTVLLTVIACFPYRIVQSIMRHTFRIVAQKLPCMPRQRRQLKRTAFVFVLRLYVGFGCQELLQPATNLGQFGHETHKLATTLLA